MSVPARSCRSSADDTADHRMHAEHAVVSAETADALNAVRAQRRPASSQSARPRCAPSRARPTTSGVIRPLADDTSIFITPGYRFKAVDVMMTNFHLPRSTLFMLVSAFCGLDVMQRAYAHAIGNGLSLLFLWRCLSAVSGAMTDPFTFRLIATDGRCPARRDRHAARHGADAGLHAGRHAGDGEGADDRTRCAAPAPKSCSATPII